MGWTLGLAIAGAATSAVGTGISVASGIQQSRRANSLAQYNSMAQEANARQQQQAMMLQAAAMRQQAGYTAAQARMNEALALSEAQARINNAQTLTNQAEAQTSADRENIKRTQQEQARFASMQRARIAGSGVVESGSPLEILAESAGDMQAALNEQQYQSELARRQTLGRAALERFGGEIAKSHAGLDLWSGLAEADLQKQSAKLEEQKGSSIYRQGMREAEISRLTGAANAQGARMGAYGSLFSGLGGLANQWTTWRGAYGGSGGFGGVQSYTGAGHSVGARPIY